MGVRLEKTIGSVVFVGILCASYFISRGISSTLDKLLFAGSKPSLEYHGEVLGNKIEYVETSKGNRMKIHVGMGRIGYLDTHSFSSVTNHMMTNDVLEKIEINTLARETYVPKDLGTNAFLRASRIYNTYREAIRKELVISLSH